MNIRDEIEMRAQAEGMVSFLVYNQGVPRKEAERKAAAMIGLLETEKPILIMHLWNLEWEKEKVVQVRKIATQTFISVAFIVLAIFILIIVL